MSQFSPQDIAKIAALASLELTDAEKEAFSYQFEQILDYFRIIAAVPIDSATATPVPGAPPFLREDEAVPSGISPADFSPHLENGHYKVPKVIE